MTVISVIVGSTREGRFSEKPAPAMVYFIGIRSSNGRVAGETQY